MKGSDYLNQTITGLTCAHATKPEDFYNLTILESLKQIRQGAHKDLVLWLRSLRNSATQTKRKKELPVFFYSGILNQHDEGNTQVYSGLIIAETDVAKDLDAARRELIANPHILAIVRSVRGQNYSVLVPVEPVPKNQQEYEAASEQVFEMLGAHLVGQGKDSAKRFRTASYDPDLFINLDSVPFPVDYSEIIPENLPISTPEPIPLPGGDGQSGNPADVRLSKLISSISRTNTMDIEKPSAPPGRQERNEGPIYTLKPEPESYDLLDHDSAFFAELNKISQEYKYIINVHLYQQLVRPLIASLCSAHENIIHRIASVIIERINGSNSNTSIELTLGDIVGDSFFDKAKKYFEHVLRCPFDLTPALNQGLRDLGSIQHVLVHQHAWIDKEKNNDLYTRIENGEIKGVSLKYGELVIRIDYAVSAVNVIMEHLEHLITLVKERYPILHHRDERQSNLYMRHKQALSN